MANGRNHMPPPDAHWLALGVVILAVATTLGPRRRKLFIKALAKFTDETEARSRVIAFGRAHSGHMPRVSRVASAWLRRVVAELRGLNP